jgi:hypothetical protein
MRTLLASVLILSACAASKPDPTDEFSSLNGLDEKSDAFSSKMLTVGTLTGSGQVQVPYTATPKYRALKFKGHAGDLIKVNVNAWAGKVKSDGDPVAWVLDNHYTIVAKNDDVSDSQTDSQIVVQLFKTATFWIVVRDYNGNDANFTVDFTLARPTGDTLSDAADIYNLYFQDDYDLASKHEIKRSTSIPKTVRNQMDVYVAAGIGGSFYKLPVGHDSRYVVTGVAEEEMWATIFDASGKVLGHGFDGDGGPGIAAWNPGADLDPTGSGSSTTTVDTNAAADAARLGFEQYWKCPDDRDVKVLGEKANMDECLSACQAEGGAGCWYLDGSGGFPHDCRVCQTLAPVKETYANDWAKSL